MLMLVTMKRMKSNKPIDFWKAQLAFRGFSPRGSDINALKERLRNANTDVMNPFVKKRVKDCMKHGVRIQRSRNEAINGHCSINGQIGQLEKERPKMMLWDFGKIFSSMRMVLTKEARQLNWRTWMEAIDVVYKLQAR